MRIACVGYRSWALSIYDQLAQSMDHTFLIFRSREQFNEDVLRDFRPDLVLFYGWSWIISDDLLKDYTCLMLHPSPLPLYRGGSPIQNQIIAGETNSKVSIFVMNNEIDAGDILAQKNLSLEGNLDEVFARIEQIGFQLTQQILRDGLNPIPQNHALATFCKRRKPEDSEITLAELQEKEAKYLYNKIRMLADPYPNAFIRTIDGKRLVIKMAVVHEDSESKAT